MNFEAEVLGPHEVKFVWKLPYPINVFSYGNVTHELRYRMVPFRSMYEDQHWVMVSLIICTDINDLNNIFASISLAAFTFTVNHYYFYSSSLPHFLSLVNFPQLASHCTYISQRPPLIDIRIAILDIKK